MSPLANITQELLWHDAPYSENAIRGRVPSTAKISAEVESGSECYALICEHIASSCAATSFSLDVGSSKSSCCSKNAKAHESRRTAALGLGLGLFSFAWDGNELYALHQTIGEPVGTGCGVAVMKSLVLFAASPEVIKGFVDELLASADKTKANTFTVYRWHPKYQYWQRDQTAVARPLESVVLPSETKARLTGDMEEFEEDETHNWYRDHGIPYKRSYLFYGVPGAGKTSLIQALAGKHGRNVCYLSPTHPEMTDDSIKSAVLKAPSRSIVILEDVDALFSKAREKKVQQSPLTFSGLLNALDGVGGSEGQVFILTTNLREELDAALIRNGRVDLHIYFGHADGEQMRLLFKQFYPQSSAAQATAFEEALLKSLSGEKVAPAALQHFFILQRKASADEAIANVHLVMEEIERRKSDDAAGVKEAEAEAAKGEGKGDEGEAEEEETDTEAAASDGMHVHVHLHGAAAGKSAPKGGTAKTGSKKKQPEKKGKKARVRAEESEEEE